jgi:hypothetical protein
VRAVHTKRDRRDECAKAHRRNNTRSRVSSRVRSIVELITPKGRAVRSRNDHDHMPIL